jgi:hypothetical protein
MLGGFLTDKKDLHSLLTCRPGNMIENKQQNMCHSAQGGKSAAV